MHIPDTTDIMGIRIDGGEQPGLFRFVAVTPVQIESPWIGIDFDRDTSFGSELYQMIEVQFTLVAPKEKPSGWVADRGGVWALDGGSNQRHHRLHSLFTSGVNACNYPLTTRHNTDLITAIAGVRIIILNTIEDFVILHFIY